MKIWFAFWVRVLQAEGHQKELSFTRQSNSEDATFVCMLAQCTRALTPVQKIQCTNHAHLFINSQQALNLAFTCIKFWLKLLIVHSLWGRANARNVTYTFRSLSRSVPSSQLEKDERLILGHKCIYSWKRHALYCVCLVSRGTVDLIRYTE